MKNSKIIYTGSTGSIGSLMPSNSKILPLFFRLEDNLNTIFKEIKHHKADTLIHLAAMIDIKKCEEEKDLCYSINIDGTKKVFLAAIKAKIKRFIYVSTSHVYETTNKLTQIDVSAKLNPKSFYAKSKLKAEKELKNIAKENPDIQLSIVRVFSILSKKMRPGSLEKKIHSLANFKKIEYIEGLNNVRDFSNSEDICKNLIKLSKSKIFPDIVNLCSEKPVIIFNLVKDIYAKYNLDFTNLYRFKIKKNKNYLIGKKTKF